MNEYIISERINEHMKCKEMASENKKKGEWEKKRERKRWNSLKGILKHWVPKSDHWTIA